MIDQTTVHWLEAVVMKENIGARLGIAGTVESRLLSLIAELAQEARELCAIECTGFGGEPECTYYANGRCTYERVVEMIREGRESDE